LALWARAGPAHLTALLIGALTWYFLIFKK
jgi:hypothetical protein